MRKRGELLTENLEESKYHKLDHICPCSGIFLLDQCLSHLVNAILENLSLNETILQHLATQPGEEEDGCLHQLPLQTLSRGR